MEHFPWVGLGKSKSAFESDMIHEQPGEIHLCIYNIRFMAKNPIPWDIWEVVFLKRFYVLKKKNTRSLEVQVVVSYAKNQLSYALGRCVHVGYNSIHHGSPKPTCLVAKTFSFMVLRGSWHPDLSISTCTNVCRTLGWIHQSFG